MAEAVRREGLVMSDREQLPREAVDDLFGPLVAEREVACLHCGRSYREGEVVWDGEMWVCPFEGCDGAGVGYDINPVSEGGGQ
jgi:hypothetical protein